MSSLGLIAGNGVFPLEVARAAHRRGHRVIALAHLNETDAGLADLVDEITWVKVGELQRMIDVLRTARVSEAAMAGGITRVMLGFDSFAPDTRDSGCSLKVGRLRDDAVLRALAG